MQQTGQPWREWAGAGAAQMSFRKGEPLLECCLNALNTIQHLCLAQGCASGSWDNGLRQPFARQHNVLRQCHTY